MGIEVDLTKVPHKNFTTISLLVVAIYIAPMFAIFQFDESLFNRIDVFRLSVIALGYGCSVLLCLTA